MHPTPDQPSWRAWHVASDPLARLRAGHQLATVIAAQRRHDIQAALAAGHTWADIADALDDTELGVFLDHHQAVTQPEPTRS